MKFFNCLPALAAGVCVLFSLAASPVRADSAWRGDPIVVTANRTEQRAANVPARISVITRADIERSQAPDLLELLRLEAGIDITRTGGPGQQTSVFMRGSSSNHVLVLIDGVRVAASGTGAFTWEILDPAVIERIEIVRGPRAARWGSDAIGGVIQIFTRRPQGVDAEVRYGSDADRRAVLGAGDQTGALALDATLAGRKVDGFSAQNPRGFSFDPDDDGFENLSATTGGALDIGPGRLSWRGRAATGETEFDQGESEFDNWSWRFDYLHDGSGPWRWQAGLATLRDRLETDSAFGNSEVVTRRLQGDVLVERDLAPGHSWLLGADAWRESGVSEGQWNRARDNVGVFTGVEGFAGRAGYEAGVRIDEDENFGTEVTGNAGVNLVLGERWRAFASGGKGFRAPSFNQLYSPGFGGLFAGNPDLEPERSWSGELGVDFTPGAHRRLTISAFGNWIDDLIDFSGENFRAINVNEARIQGLEFTHDWARAGWSSRFNLTWQDPEDRETGDDLLRRSDFKGSWTLGYRWAERWNLDGELVHVGDRLDVGNVRLGSYTLVNLRAGVRLLEHWRAEVRVDNLADRDYEPAVGFNAADRRVFAALGWGR
ncbi:MAG: TonB-dependent receptor [Wenzhouxiangellaceae bacterium]|nr:TonB-dependent receptor [Wenzhouxiangellaceae bacterium]